MTKISFKQVDVFTLEPLLGNPVAVILDGTLLSSAQMQAVANWTNLSETTFVLPAEDPDASYKLRIFTPKAELPFAGHPTIGSAHALLEAGLVHPNSNGTLVQECGAGLLTLTVGKLEQGDRIISVKIPEPTFKDLSEEQVNTLEKVLGTEIDRSLTPLVVDVGPKFIVASVKSGEAAVNLNSDLGQEALLEKEVGASGITLYGPYTESAQSFIERIETRTFAPLLGVSEDPVCGSGNGAVGAFIRRHGAPIPASKVILSSQGTRVGRDGKITITVLEDLISIGGSAVTVIDGSVSL